jgi:hypothetical protein
VDRFAPLAMPVYAPRLSAQQQPLLRFARAKIG